MPPRVENYSKDGRHVGFAEIFNTHSENAGKSIYY